MVAGEPGDLTDGLSGHDSNSQLISAVVNSLFVWQDSRAFQPKMDVDVFRTMRLRAGLGLTHGILSDLLKNEHFAFERQYAH